MIATTTAIMGAELAIGLVKNLTSAVGAYYGYQLDKTKLQEQIRQFELTRADRQKEQQLYFEKNIKEKENDYFLNHHWPLNISPKRLDIRKNKKGEIILRVILGNASSSDKNINAILESTWQKLLSYLEDYSKSEHGHQILFMHNGWNDKPHNDIQSDLDSLYQILKGQPHLILFPLLSGNGDRLTIRASFWGIGKIDKDPELINLLDIDLGKIRRDVAREYAKKWRDTCRSLEDEEKEALNLKDSSNLQILEKEESLFKALHNPADIEKKFTLYEKYIVDDSRFTEDISMELSAMIYSTIASVADIYYYMEYRKAPSIPYVLTHISNPYYLSKISDSVLPLYTTLRDTITENDTDFPSLVALPLNELSSQLETALKEAGIYSQTVSLKDFTNRLMWDVRTSEILRKNIVPTIDAQVIEKLSQHFYNLTADLDSNIDSDKIKSGVEAFLRIQEGKNVSFSYSYRFPVLKEFSKCAGLAAYMVYKILKKEGGINWLIAYHLADNISKETSRKFNTIPPSRLMHNNYPLIEELLSDILKSYNLIVDKISLKKLSHDGWFLENIRIMTDILHRENRR